MVSSLRRLVRIPVVNVALSICYFSTPADAVSYVTDTVSDGLNEQLNVPVEKAIEGEVESTRSAMLESWRGRELSVPVPRTTASAAAGSSQAPPTGVTATTPGTARVQVAHGTTEANSEQRDLALTVLGAVRGAVDAVSKQLTGVHLRRYAGYCIVTGRDRDLRGSGPGRRRIAVARCSVEYHSEARDRLLHALGRLLDSLVDVLAIPSSSEGVENTVREELTSKIANLLKGSADDDDLFASRTVRA